MLYWIIGCQYDFKEFRTRLTTQASCPKLWSFTHLRFVRLVYHSIVLEKVRVTEISLLIKLTGVASYSDSKCWTLLKFVKSSNGGFGGLVCSSTSLQNRSSSKYLIGSNNKIKKTNFPIRPSEASG